MGNILKGILVILIIGIVLLSLFGLISWLLVFITPIIIIASIIAMFFKKRFRNKSINFVKDINKNGNNINICQATINDCTYITYGDCKSFVYRNGKIFINGREQDGKTPNINTIIVNGNIDKLETDSSVSVTGNVGSINAGGSVNCDDVKGNIHAGGSVNCDDVGGSITAGGSVCSN